MSQKTLYDRDFYAWVHEQASLLRSSDLALADTAHIAEEIESMGKAEKREVASRLTALLADPQKWRFQPGNVVPLGARQSEFSAPSWKITWMTTQV